MGVTDMRHPIQYALTYPERLPAKLPPLDLASVGSLTFEEPDVERFPCLKLAFDALRAGGSMPAAMNAANEVAVNAFLSGEIGFADISKIVAAVIDVHSVASAGNMEAVIEADIAAREHAKGLVSEASRSALAA